MNCASRIRALREDHDFSQKYIASVLHVAQTTYSDYEKGKVRIPLDSVIILAELYDVNLDYISGISNEKIPFPKR